MTKTNFEIKESVNNLGYKLLDLHRKEYKHTRVIIQDEIGYIYDVDLPSLIIGHIPNFVGIGNKKHSSQNINLWLSINRKDFKLCDGNYFENSKKKLKFYHEKCDEYFEMNWDKIFQMRGCPVCRGMQVGKKTSLAYLRPDLAKEWHPIKNEELTPYDIVCNSGKGVWWICSEGHEYIAPPNRRVSGKTGCKRCSDERQESLIAKKLKQWCQEFFGNLYKSEYRILKNPKTNKYLPFDIYLGNVNSVDGIYIEIHGSQHYYKNGWHERSAKQNETTPEEEFEYQKKRDRIKRKFARQNGVYIEVDLRKTKTIEDAIEFVMNIIKETI